jgi:hypothetical protein
MLDFVSRANSSELNSNPPICLSSRITFSVKQKTHSSPLTTKIFVPRHQGVRPEKSMFLTVINVIDSVNRSVYVFGPFPIIAFK